MSTSVQLPKLIAVLDWIKTNVVAVLIAAFVIPGVLAVFNQQGEVTKAIFETDYKAARTKYLECDRFHGDYLTAITSNAGLAIQLQKFFNADAIAKYGESQTYFIAFKGLMDAYQKSLVEVQGLYSKASQCYSELNVAYDNLALALDLSDKSEEARNGGAEKITALMAQRDAIVADIAKRYNLDGLFFALVTADDQATMAMLRTIDFGDLAREQSKNIEVETAARDLERSKFIELNKLFSAELSKRLHRGLLSYFSSLFRI